METLIVMLAAAAVFGLFFLAFLIRRRPKDRPVDFRGCPRCTCRREDRPPPSSRRCDHR